MTFSNFSDKQTFNTSDTALFVWSVHEDSCAREVSDVGNVSVVSDDSNKEVEINDGFYSLREEAAWIVAERLKKLPTSAQVPRDRDFFSQQNWQHHVSCNESGPGQV